MRENLFIRFNGVAHTDQNMKSQKQKEKKHIVFAYVRES